MNDLDLDTRIRDAAPHLASVDGLSDSRARILKEARARRGRQLRVWGASAAASILLVGGGSVAMAGGGDETPWGWVADNVFSIERTDGSAFSKGLLVKWDGLAEDDPIVVDAKAIVSGMDLESLDTTAKEAELSADYAAATNDKGESAPIVMSSAELKQQAIFQMVADERWPALAIISVKVTNAGSVGAAVDVEWTSGSKSDLTIDVDKSAVVALNSRSPQLPGGSVVATITGEVDGQPVSVTQSVEYASLACKEPDG